MLFGVKTKPELRGVHVKLCVAIKPVSRFTQKLAELAKWMCTEFK